VQPLVEELPDSRVRLTVEVPQADVEHAVEHAASDLAESTKVPGFRKGKVPMQVLLARIGKERLFAEAVESHIGGWFLNAAARGRIRPVEQPEYDYELPASRDEDWRFTATVAVAPKPELPDWKELEVPVPEGEVPDELVEQELDALRASVAELAPVEGRPAQLEDTVVVDLVNANGETQHDYVVEVGDPRLVAEMNEALVGTPAGETRTAEWDGGRVEITVKEIKERVLPPVDDDLARAASEFETLAELKADIESRLEAALDEEIEGAVRAAAADALVEAAKVDVAGPLVEQRTRELYNGLVRSLARRGVSIDTYVALSGLTPEQLVERLRAEAEQSVARELVLEAAADRLEIEVSDEEVEALVREQAAEAGDEPDGVIEAMRHSGAFEQLRDDLRLRAALDQVAADVKRIPSELADARERLWTPEKEKPETPTKLWTPGSKEPA
jgi:trigger factor